MSIKSYMPQITERDKQLLDMIIKFKMVSYDMAREVYQNKWAIYKRINKLVKDGMLKKVGRNHITLGQVGISFVNFEWFVNFEPLNNPTSEEMMYRWAKVVEIANREYIYTHFTNCWDLKSETRKQGNEMSDKNKILGVARGYGIYKISKDTRMRTLLEMIADFKEATSHNIYDFIVFCETPEKIRDFLQVVEQVGKLMNIRRLHILPYTESGLKIMDTIIGIPDWKDKVVKAVYGDDVKASSKNYAEYEWQGKEIYVGIDTDLIGKEIIKAEKSIRGNMNLEILCIRGQEERYKDLNLPVKTITMPEFLMKVGYKNNENK